ncbi:MAG TPA: hypothetical protein VNA65_11965, partial [Candidatus Dormibacteraeota bacterium]|nr:hypothetical protein [Candidatus Dormibacteraeota bacterium]
IAALGSLGITVGRIGVAAGAWASAVSLAAIWIPLRSTQELALGQLGFGSSLDVRIDSVAFVFGLMIAIPASILLTLQRSSWQESAIAMLALTAAMAAIEVGGVVLTAVAGGTAATLALVLLETEDPAAPRPSWAALLAGWLALAWVGVLLQIRGGTAVYAAVPISTVTPAIFGLLGVSALVVSGLFPWRGWPVRLSPRPKLDAAGVIIATLFPLGFYLLVRAYELGDGKYPHPAFNATLAVIGVLVAFGAALRAQAAPARREFFAQVVSAFGGIALMSIGLGTPVGLVAGLVLLATAAALNTCVALLGDGANGATLIAIAACAGLPPGIAFGALALSIESTFEAGDFLGFVGLSGIVTWAIWVVASARAAGLPASEASTAERFPRAAAAIALVTMLAGPALAAFAYGFADPVAASVMQPVTVSFATRFSELVTTSTVLPALTLFAPLLLIALFAYPGLGLAALELQPRPPVITLRGPDWWIRARAVVMAARMPEQYRSLVNFQELEKAAASGKPWLWIATLAALGFAVTR